MYLPTNEIERQVAQQDHIWYPIPEDTRGADLQFWADLSFVGAYYAFIAANRRLPTQDEYISYYFEGNERSVATSPDHIIRSMYHRAGRNYRIFACEHHLFSLCIESRAFNLAYKSEELDLEGTVDLLLKFHGYEAGIALTTNGRQSDYWGKVKERRREVRDKKGGMLWTGPIVPYLRDTRKMKKLSNLPLFREDAPGQLAALIQKEMLFNEMQTQ